MSVFKNNKPADLPPRRRQNLQDPPKSELASSQLFKRNRTLTGSSSGMFGSAGEQQADILSPRAAAHELAAKRRHLSRMLAGVSLGLIFVAFLLWQLIMGVSVYGANGVALQSDIGYDKAISEYLSRQPLQRFRISLDEVALTAFVSRTHPEVESIELSQPNGLASSKFEIITREPIAKWRVSGADQYVDRSGVAFAVNYHDTPAIQIADDSGIDPSSGAAVASARFLGFVGNVVRLSESLGHNPVGVRIPPSSTRQIEVSFGDFPYPVKFTTDRPAGEQVEDMGRAVGYMKSNKVTPDYLDVRVSGRAYYK